MSGSGVRMNGTAIIREHQNTGKHGMIIPLRIVNMYYVADLGASTLGIAALRSAPTTAATTALSVFVPRFLFRILPLCTLNPLSLFKNFLAYFIVYIYHCSVTVFNGYSFGPMQYAPTETASPNIRENLS